jgi:hypothetical protein
MKRVDSLLLKVFLYGIPGVALAVAIGYCCNLAELSHRNLYANLFNAFSGFVFALWMLLSLYLSFRLIVSGPFRDQVIARITFRRERDEREAMLTGRATRITFLTSLAFLVLLFCLSCFQVAVYRVPPEKAVNGKTGFVTLGLGFSLTDRAPQAASADAPGRRNIFSYQGLPVSNATIILALIAWHILSYNYFMRRLMR